MSGGGAAGRGLASESRCGRVSEVGLRGRPTRPTVQPRAACCAWQNVAPGDAWGAAAGHGATAAALRRPAYPPSWQWHWINSYMDKTICIQFREDLAHLHVHWLGAGRCQRAAAVAGWQAGLGAQVTCPPGVPVVQAPQRGSGASAGRKPGRPHSSSACDDAARCERPERDALHVASTNRTAIPESSQYSWERIAGDSSAFRLLLSLLQPVWATAVPTAIGGGGAWGCPLSRGLLEDSNFASQTSLETGAER